MSLDFITPEITRDPSPEAVQRGRTRGALGLVLRGNVIADWVKADIMERYAEYYSQEGNDEPKVRADDMLLLRSPIGELAIIGDEGVGEPVPEDKGTIPAYVAVGWEYQLVQLPHAVVQQAMAPEAVDVADWVRIFGDRLDNNAYIWRRFVGTD